MDKRKRIYIATYVDDIMVFSKEPLSVIKEIESTYSLKGVGTPRFYLGGDILELDEHWTKANVKTSLSAETYITNMIPKFMKLLNLVTLAKSSKPMSPS